MDPDRVSSDSVSLRACLRRGREWVWDRAHSWFPPALLRPYYRDLREVSTLTQAALCWRRHRCSLSWAPYRERDLAWRLLVRRFRRSQLRNPGYLIRWLLEDEPEKERTSP